MITVKVSSRNQIALPSKIRKQLGISPGDQLEVVLGEGSFTLERRTKSWTERLASIAPDIWKDVGDAQEYVNDLRDEWSHRER